MRADAAGGGAAVWAEILGSDAARLSAARLVPGTEAWSAAEAVRPGETTAQVLERALAVDREGTPAVVWAEQPRPFGTPDLITLFAARYALR